MSATAKTVLLISLAALLGACAGLWDMTDGTLAATLAILGLSGFILSLLMPRWSVIAVLGLVVGVMLANLAGWPPPGTRLGDIDRSLIAAAVAALPATIGALLGLCAASAARRMGH